MFCAQCGTQNHDSARHCTNCGAQTGFAAAAPAGATPPPPPAAAPYASGNVIPKSRLAYILLALFLGCLGIHNFYAGYAGRGIAQLLISLFLGWLIVPLAAVVIWIIIEICTVTRDAQGVPFN
jgi:TM2 domain-containing membrane protein YozV